MRFVATACSKGLACVFGFGSAFVCKVKNHDKPEARCDPQARIKWAAVGFFVVWRETEHGKKYKGAAVRKREELQKA
ncbi:MAG TPA: hypothetical protein DCY97_10275 [Marinilabiliales bacterium]|jgi:hypothetical protein|nr:hypothetical protein [Marinilabiliales bacterium]